jgi:hypothetical protein
MAPCPDDCVAHQRVNKELKDNNEDHKKYEEYFVRLFDSVKSIEVAIAGIHGKIIGAVVVIGAVWSILTVILTIGSTWYFSKG